MELKQQANRRIIMAAYILKLARIKDENRTCYGIEETDYDTGELLAITELGGESISPSCGYEVLMEVGFMDGESEIDDYWRAVDCAIYWIAEHAGLREARRLYARVYAGIVPDDDMADSFRGLVS
jgi:homospermidine synthase